TSGQRALPAPPQPRAPRPLPHSVLGGGPGRIIGGPPLTVFVLKTIGRPAASYLPHPPGPGQPVLIRACPPVAHPCPDRTPGPASAHQRGPRPPAPLTPTLRRCPP